MKKSILTKLSALAAVFVMAAIAWVTCLNVPAPAKAEALFTSSDEGVIVTESVKPADYLSIPSEYGTKITFPASNTSATFSKTFTIKEGDNSIIKLASHPSEREVGQTLETSNIERLIIRVEKVGDPEQFFAIDFASDLYTSANSDDWTKSGTVGLRAYGPKQKVLGEDQTAKNNLRGTGTPATFSFNKGREKDVLEFTYNQSTTALRSTGMTFGNYPSTFRTFKKASTADSATWNGFAVGDEVKVTISVVSIASAADIFVYSVGGEAAIAPLAVSVQSKAITYDANADKPVSYTLPEPKYFESATAEPVDFGTQDGSEYKIEKVGADDSLTIVTGDTTDPDNTGWVAYTGNTATQLLTEAGYYKISYRMPIAETDPVEYHETSVLVETVTAEQAADLPIVVTPIKTNWENDICMPGYNLEAAATLSSGMDMEGHDTVTKQFAVFKDNGDGVYDDATDGDPVVTGSVDGGSNYFSLTDEGLYFVVYGGSDALGRLATSAAFPLTISNQDHKFRNGNASVTVAFGSDSAYFKPSADDIEFFDLRLVGQDPNADIDITIQKPETTEYVAYDANFKFDVLGTYKIRYVISYEADSTPIETTLERSLRVVDVTPPTLSATRIPLNTVLDEDKNAGETVVYLRAKKGVTITLPEVRAYDSVGTVADLNSEIQYTELLAGGTTVGKTAEYLANKTGYTVALTSVGEYVFKFTVLDSAGMQASLIYIVDVREKWLSLEVQDEVIKTQQSGAGVTVPSFRVVDLNGNTSTAGTVTAELILKDEVVKTDVGGKTFTDLAPGEYTLVYTVTESAGVSYTKSYTLTVTDTSKPVITADGVVSTGKTGKAVAVATFAATDNDVIKDSALTITFGEEKINTYEGAFTPAKPGAYVVTYTVEDVSGNVATYSYTVNVTGKAIGEDEGGLPAWAIVLIVVGGVIVLAAIAFAVLVILNKKGITKIAFIDKIWNWMKKVCAAIGAFFKKLGASIKGLFTKKSKKEEPEAETTEDAPEKDEE